MKQIISHLRKNWIKYGFETFAILIGILGAQYLSNLNENRKEKDTELEYLSNLILELESQAATTESQISFETHNKEICETLLELIYEAPWDVDHFNQDILELSRKTYLVSNAVFEDMKNSGHVAIISDPDLRYELFQSYQQTEYVEAVISRNNCKQRGKDPAMNVIS